MAEVETSYYLSISADRTYEDASEYHSEAELVKTALLGVFESTEAIAGFTKGAELTRSNASIDISYHEKQSQLVTRIVLDFVALESVPLDKAKLNALLKKELPFKTFRLVKQAVDPSVSVLIE